MASVFTYDPNPPKLTSPWPVQPILTSNMLSNKRAAALDDVETCAVADLANFDITKLQAEPQEGPMEYKLHLLLRPRRSFLNSSTTQHVSGSYQSTSRALQSGLNPETRQTRVSSSPVPSDQSRQNRLQHLTTQLLWRLQQSSPYHSSSKSDLVVPVLPQTRINPSTLDGPDKLPPGLEESQGALYELGISDDGAFIGLTGDELEESLMTLRAMAFSLGCRVRMIRKVIVGDCQWKEEAESPKGVIKNLRHDNLYVAEALVVPDLGFCQHAALINNPASSKAPFSLRDTTVEQSESQTEQLRVSLTGDTTSGKSSLLGTLSTSTLDNGRGKSRLSLLKHPHEIISGISSSVTPELIGYHDAILNGQNTKSCSTIINYASGNVSSWNDIHTASEPGRLVLVTDSAGHPRYRRTIVRGLVSWAPHWTMCCIAADSGDGVTEKIGIASARGNPSAGAARPAGYDSSMAHLNLCLRLELPLIVAITKYDLASKMGLRQLLNKVLSILKSAGRIPHLLREVSVRDQAIQLHSIAAGDKDAVINAIASCSDVDTHLMVPIVFTSTVSGVGINKIHALLRHLPILPTQNIQAGDGIQSESSIGKVLFHVDEVFSKSDGQLLQNQSRDKRQGLVLSGYLRYGDLSIGDTFFIGPFTRHGATDNVHGIKLHRASSFPETKKHNADDDDRPLSYESSYPTRQFKKSCYLTPCWKKIHVVSLRNLRFPVRKLLAGQVGTVGVIWDDPRSTNSSQPLISNRRVRKGMVMIRPDAGFDSKPPSSFIGFTAVFDAIDLLSLLPGNLVVAYIASVRATAKIVSIRNAIVSSEDSAAQRQQEITLHFMASREWIELGTQVLIMVEGRPSLSHYKRKEAVGARLEGYGGRITQTLE